MTIIFQGAVMNAASWTINPFDFQYDMIIYLDFTLSGKTMDYNEYTFGAFVNDEIRGVGEILNVETMTSPVIEMRVHSNVSEGEKIIFKALNNKTDRTFESPSEIIFKNLETIGLPSSPYLINFVVPVVSIKLDLSSYTGKEGTSVQLNATVSPENATDKAITWKTSDKAVASVDKSGLVSLISMGSAIITATCGEVSASCAVTVTAPDVKKLEINPSSITLVEEETFQLEAVVTPPNAATQLKWSSSNMRVAVVDEVTGFLTASSTGTAVITVASVEGLKATCEVTVIKKIIEATEIVLTPTVMTLKEGDTGSISAVVYPEDTSDKSIIWSSSDENIAIVENGNIKALNEGMAVITAKCGNVSANCKVTVIKNIIEVESITLNIDNYTGVEGTTVQIIATITPEDATDRSVAWTSSDSEIASVDEKGLVSLLKGGTASIIATSSNGLTATCLITVTEKIISPERIELNMEEITLYPGEIYLLVAEVYPEETTDKTLIWSSSDENVAMVNYEGMVTATGEGEAIITVTCGDVSASCSVFVTSPVILPERIELNQTHIELAVGETVRIIATVYPEDTTDQNLIWESLNPEVATVSEEGDITGISEGETTIRVICGDVEAECAVTVNDDSGVESIFITNEDKISIFTIEGHLIKKDSNQSELKSLSKGVYILKSGNKIVKITL